MPEPAHKDNKGQGHTHAHTRTGSDLHDPWHPWVKKTLNSKLGDKYVKRLFCKNFKKKKPKHLYINFAYNGRDRLGEVAEWEKNHLLHTCRSCIKQGNKTLNHPLAPSQTHLEKVILVHNTTVGQRLNQPVCQGCFAPISDPESQVYI